jgi:uncharacterized protein
MVKETPFQVLVRELPTHRSFKVSAELVGEWLKGLPMRDALEAPDGDPDAGHGSADLELYADGAHAFATGAFHGELTVACSRCVSPVTLVIDEKLQVTFMPRHEIPDSDEPAGARKPSAAGGKAAGGKAAGGKAAADDDEGPEITDEDLDLFPFDGERIDLEPLFREQFVLAIPYAPLCMENCKGLCQHCGTNLNTGSCSCAPPIDPRLAPLKGLKIPS